MQLEKLPSIWHESPLTISLPNKAAIIDRSKRFQYNSIYYKDDPFKQKKKVDEFMFPHDLLINFRKCIRDASKSNSPQKERYKKKKSTQQEEIQRQEKTLSPKVEKLIKKLYHKPAQVSKERDSFGNRITFENSRNQIVKLPLVDSINVEMKEKPQKIFITASQRINLGRPVNFNPGPGAYLSKTILITKTRLGKSMQHNDIKVQKIQLTNFKSDKSQYQSLKKSD